MSNCRDCKHNHGGNSCAAYPHRIPIEILTGEKGHDKPYAGDGGVVYVPRDAKDWEDLLSLD